MAHTYDLVIKGGLVVTGSSIQKADLGVKGEKIAAIQPGLPLKEAGRVIDASGKYVMPGAIDVHVHPVYEDDLGGTSVTAAHGGTTTLIHYAYAKPGMKLVDAIVNLRRRGWRSPVSTLASTEPSLIRPSRWRRFRRPLALESLPLRCL